MKEQYQDSFVIPLDLRTKHEILDECNDLLIAYSKYRRVERIGQDFPKGKSDWFSQLEKTYLKICSDIKKSDDEEYKKIVEILDKYIDGETLKIKDAIKCTKALISFINFVGITRFFIPKKSFEDKLEDEL